jgi:hypothetical protein
MEELMNIRLSLASALTAIALIPALAQAGDVFLPGTGGIKNVSGVVDQNGKVVAGKGFTAARNGTGDYTLSFPAGSFPTHGPALTCSGAGANGGVPICVIYGLNWQIAGTTTVNVRIWNQTGAAQDNAFHFTEITTKS